MVVVVVGFWLLFTLLPVRRPWDNANLCPAVTFKTHEAGGKLRDGTIIPREMDNLVPEDHMKIGLTRWIYRSSALEIERYI